MDRLRKELEIAHKCTTPVHEILTRKRIDPRPYKPDPEIRLTSEELKRAVLGEENKPQ